MQTCICMCKYPSVHIRTGFFNESTLWICFAVIFNDLFAACECLVSAVCTWVLDKHVLSCWLGIFRLYIFQL